MNVPREPAASWQRHIEFRAGGLGGFLKRRPALLQGRFNPRFRGVDGLPERFALLGREPSERLHLRGQFAGLAQVLHARLVERGQRFCLADLN